MNEDEQENFRSPEEKELIKETGKKLGIKIIKLINSDEEIAKNLPKYQPDTIMSALCGVVVIMIETAYDGELSASEKFNRVVKEKILERRKKNEVL